MNATTNSATVATTAATEIKSPAVGDGMTMHFPQDSYPFVIVAISASGKTAKVKPLKTVDLTTGHKPARFDGPFPVWSHSYTDEERASMIVEEAPERTVRLTKNGWTSHGTPFSVGSAHFHRNYSY